MNITITADGNYPASGGIPFGGNMGQASAVGTFGGGTLTLQFSNDNGTHWQALDSGSDAFTTYTATGKGGFGALQPCLLRWVMSGSTTPSVVASVGQAAASGVIVGPNY